MYKIIFSDLDGTLLPENENISSYTQSVISQIQELGIPIILASGRSNIAMRYFHQKLGLVDPMISYNGAWIEKNGVVSYYQPLQHSIARKLYDFAQLKGIYFQFYHKGTLITSNRYKDSELFLEYGHSNRIEMMSHEDNSPTILDKLQEVTKWMFINKNRDELESLASELQDFIGLEANMSFTSSAYFEIYHKEVNKGHAAMQVLKACNLKPEDAISFGDNFNDVELLEVAGLSYAMKNAPDGVKAKSKKTTSFRCEEDGVAKILSEIFLSK